MISSKLWIRLGIAAVVVAIAATYVTAVLQTNSNSIPARWVAHAAKSLDWGGGDKSGEHAPQASDTKLTSEDAHELEEHSHGDHEHAHSETSSLALSPEAMANLGLTEDMIQPVAETSFVRSVTVPAIVVERPGRTRLPVSTPMTGIVTHVHAVTGEAVTPGTVLFQLRLTHEDLVTAQTAFLQSLGELAVEEKEIARLQTVSESGAIPGRVLIERKYARDKLLASLNSQREALRLHGLSIEQIERIEKELRLLTELTIRVPSVDGHEHDGDDLQLSREPIIRQTAYEFTDPAVPKTAAPNAAEGPTLIVQQLRVHKGDTVSTGDVLCVLADYSELFIEGQAFESDAGSIADAKRRGWKAAAVIEQSGGETEIDDLEIAYLSNEIDPVERTLEFYVSLKNGMTEDVRNDREQRFVTWKYRPGQRLQLRVPVEEWIDQLVVPADAVVREGPDSFIFQQNGDHFERVPVHERFRDRKSVVVANDGAIFPGDVVAQRGAHQMQLSLKNKAGGGVDPHAGHNH